MNKCYVCIEETIYKSPCECKLYLCKECFKRLLKNNINKCTICKSNYETKKILLSKCTELTFRNSPNIKSTIIDISEIYISDDEEEVNVNNNFVSYKIKKSVQLFLLLLCFFFVVLFGNIINNMITGTNFISYFNVNMLTILYGIICFLLLFLLFELLYCLYIIIESIL
jgi:hypothetical protein